MNEKTAEFVNSCYVFSTLDSRQIGMGHDSRISSKGLLERLKSGKSLSWDEITHQFPRVKKRIEGYAVDHHLDPKSVEAVRGYWLVEHNRLIDGREEEYSNMPDSQRELCKTHSVKIIEVIARVGDVTRLRVRHENGKEQDVVDFFHTNLKSGDYLTLHKNIVSERITRSEYKKYSMGAA